MKYELNLLERERKGRKEGEKKLATLMDLLYKEHRFEDMGRAASDEEYKEKLYKEYNIQWFLEAFFKFLRVKGVFFEKSLNFTPLT